MRSLHNTPGRYLMKVSGGIRHKLDTFVEGTSMTAMEARALQYIAAADTAVYQRDLEQEYGLSAATISELMQNMEAKGIVRRETDPDDRRKKRIVIPEAIRPQVDVMLGRMADMEAQLVKDIDPAKLQVFMEVIEQMSHNIPPYGK